MQFLQHLITLSFSFALLNVFLFWISLTYVSSSPSARPLVKAVRLAVLYFQLVYKSFALSSHESACVPAVATAENKEKSSLCD